MADTNFERYVSREQSDRASAERMANKFNDVAFTARDSNGAAIYSADYFSNVPRWLDSVYDNAVSAISDDEEVKSMGKYIDMVMGRHWPANRASWRPSPVFNRIYEWFWDNVANLTDVRLNIDVRSEDKNYIKTAENLTKAAQTNYRSQHGNIAVIFTLMHSMLSVGYTKVGPDHEAQDIAYLPCGSDTVIPILPNIYDFQKSSGAVYRTWKPLTFFKERFPAVAHKVQAEETRDTTGSSERPWGIDDYSWNAMTPSFRNYVYGSDDVRKSDQAWSMTRTPVAMYNEFWFRDPQINTSGRELTVGYNNFTYKVPPRGRIYPYGRVIMTANTNRRVILYDGPNYHWHGMFPFACLRTQPVPWMWSSASEFRQLWPIQEPTNKMIGDAMSLLNQATNKLMIVKDGAISAASWNNYFPGMPGAKLKILDKLTQNIDNVIKWIGPDIAALSAVPALWGIFTQGFNEISGKMDMGRLAAKKQIPSPDSIKEFRDSQQSRNRIKGQFLEAYFDDMSRLLVSDMLQFYTRDKVLSTLGSDGMTWEYFDWDPGTMVPGEVRSAPFDRGRKYARSFTPMVAAGSGLPAQRRENAQMAMMLWKMGAIDLESMYKILVQAGYQLPDVQTVMINRQKEQAILPQKPAKAGAKK